MFYAPSLSVIIVHVVLLSSAFYISRMIWLSGIQRQALVGLITGFSIYEFCGILVYLYSLTILMDRVPFPKTFEWDRLIL